MSDTDGPDEVPHGEGGDGSAPSSHVVYNPLPPVDGPARRQRAMRRMERSRHAPTWTKKILWFLFPTYGIMRVNDPDFEEHSDQWREQQRRNYEGDSH